MILDSLSNAAQYASIHPLFSSGFAYLAEYSAKLEEGRHQVAGDRLFALVQSYTTSPDTGGPFEAHRRYIDIQYLHRGVETINHAPILALVAISPFDRERDLGLFAAPAIFSRTILREGDFAVFFPNDGHQPCLSYREPCAVRKVVLKIAV